MLKVFAASVEEIAGRIDVGEVDVLAEGGDKFETAGCVDLHDLRVGEKTLAGPFALFFGFTLREIIFYRVRIVAQMVLLLVVVEIVPQEVDWDVLFVDQV